MRGVVVCWDYSRGYGFVRDSESGVDFYAHIYQWRDHSKVPELGMRVEWDGAPPRIEGRSPQAMNIRLFMMVPAALAALIGGKQ
jgi:cold shock CspA family protein